LKNAVKKKDTNQIKELNKCKFCEIHTVETEDGRIRTIVLLSDGRALYLTDLDLNLKHVFSLPDREKDDIGEIRLAGKKNLVVCGITKHSGRVYIWNGTEVINSIEKYEH
jgi:hypothetical protein